MSVHLTHASMGRIKGPGRSRDCGRGDGGRERMSRDGRMCKERGRMSRGGRMCKARGRMSRWMGGCVRKEGGCVRREVG